MIQIIGIKKIMIVLFLLAINAALAAGLYMYVVPESDTAERQLRTTRAQVQKKRTDAAGLRTDIEQIEEKKAYYNNLEKAGFRSDQNRLAARRRIMDIQQYSKVLKAGYSIGSAEVIEDPDLKGSNQVVLKSKIDINLDAMDDIDIYSFIYWLRHTFPGHVNVDTLSITRAEDVNDVTVRRIGSGDPVVMVRANLTGTWRTVVPKDVLNNQMTVTGEGF